MLMTYEPAAKVFVVKSKFEEKDVPKAAGFVWDRIVKNRWATRDVSKAHQLAPWADQACQEALLALLKEQKELIKLSSATDAEIEFPSPEGLSYLGYQKVGILFAIKRRRVLIADDMGLGKTIQAIGVINSQPDINKVLYITKASLRINVCNELHRWLTRKLSVDLAFGQHWPAGADIIIINYDILKNHQCQIQDTVWDLLVLDEAHMVKNPRAIRTRMVFGHIPKDQKEQPVPPIKARFVTALTGSPIENRPIEIHGLLKYLDPKNWGYFWGFVNEFCGAKNEGYGWDFSGCTNKAKFGRKLRETVMLRRLKRDVLKELPEKRYQIIEIPVEDAGLKKFLGEEVRKHDELISTVRSIKKAMKEAKLAGDQATFRDLINLLKETVKPRFEEFSRIRHETGVRKLPYVKEYLKELLEEEPHKVLVFGHHHDVVNGLQKEFPVSVLVSGEVAPDKRQALVDRFQNEQDLLLFFGSIGAAGAGLNLTAAEHVIFAEEDFVPEKMTQAEDRAHRIGQKGSVLVTHLVLEGSLDARIAKIAVLKGGNIDAIMETPKEVEEEIDTQGWGSLLPQEQKPDCSPAGDDACPF
jgi:SWI/SNF-related matrix-associated actin-dependent regulator 1 of chromatin subfamily A